MGLYNRVTGNQIKREGQKGPATASASGELNKPEPKFIFTEREQAFGHAYRSYEVEGVPKMDPETFFRRIRLGLIEAIKRELGLGPRLAVGSRSSARLQTTMWIRFVKDNERIALAFNSRMMNLNGGSDLDQIVDGMFAHTMTQIENPALLNSRFKFDEVLFLDANFHQLNLMRGSSYLRLSCWLAKNKAIINRQNNDEECFKWAVIAALEFPNIKSHPERISNLIKFSNNYDWSGLEFPVSIKDIGVFEANNNILVNVLAVEGREIYIHRKS